MKEVQQMIKNNKLITIVMILITFVSLNTISAAALQTFTDVGENHWAKEYIEKMEKKGIITGYEDATFRPSKNVSKLATIVMMFRTIRAADKLGNFDVDVLVEKYKDALKENNVPNWPDFQEAVAFALENNIIHIDELKTFIINGAHQNAKRSDVAVFLGKALNLYLKEDIYNKIYSFDFKDAEFITTAAAPYIDLLVRKNIINGDENGNFKPNQPIQRAAVAKMLSVAYDILVQAENSNEQDNTQQIEDEQEIEQLTIEEAKIILVVEDNDTIVVEKNNKEREMYKIEDEVKIIIDKKEADIDDLEEEANVKLYFDEDEKLIKIEVYENITFFEGKIHSLIDMGDYYLITVKDKNKSSRKKVFTINDDTVITLDGEEIKPEELDAGDNVSLEIEDDIAVKIVAESKIRIYEGILQTGLVFDEYPKLTIKASDQQVYELEVDEDAEVKKNNKTRSLTSLVKGDLVTVTTEDGKIVKVIATSIKNEDEGVIKAITISNESKITILNDEEERTYQLAPNVDIEIDNKDATIYDLKIDYRVKLTIESDIVKEIEAEKIETSDKITGVITEIYKDFEAIKVKVVKDKETKYVSVSAADATIISVSGSKVSFKYLDEDDEIFIYGKESNEIFDFIADKIIILKNN